MIKLFSSDKFFLVLLSVAIILSRLFVFYFYRDINLENEWINLFHNLKTSGVLGYHVLVDNNLLVQKFSGAGDVVIPSVWMPPFYIFFLYSIDFVFGRILPFVSTIIIIQILLNLFSIYIFFKIIKNFFDNRDSLLITIIYAFFPALIFSSVQISSSTLQIFLILCFFYFLLENFLKSKKLSVINFSIISGMLILTRGEFVVFYILAISYFFIFKEKKFKNLIVSLIVTLLIISPYLIRNYKNFNTVVLTKSFGYNLLKGNNQNFKVEGDVVIINKIRENLNIKIDNNFEINLDNIYRDEAIKYIKENPGIFVQNYFKKVFSFLFINLNSSYDNYYNPFHIIPKAIISLCALFSGIIGLRKGGFFQFLSIFYFLNILLFSLFFILPRYSVVLIPVQIILTSMAFKTYKEK